MRQVLSTLGLIAVLAGAAGSTSAQKSADGDLIAVVRAAIASRGMTQAEKVLAEYRSTRGATGEAIEALSWLARGALAAKQFDKANQYAADAYDLAVEALKDHKLATDPHLRTAIAAAIEITASIMVADGARSEAVSFLRRELETFHETPTHDQIQANLDRVTLEGHPAPRMEAGLHLGPRVPSVSDLKGRVVLVFFWAHWCPECKAESPSIAKLLDKYRSKGLAIVAPTELYGYVEAGRPAPPDRELRYILEVRNTYYGFLRNEPVPVSEANYKEYGVTTMPMHVLLDRQGVIRLYRPGRMTEAELEAAIRDLL
jgi:thiol-disulfide isomerase/thioredoxin